MLDSTDRLQKKAYAASERAWAGKGSHLDAAKAHVEAARAIKKDVTMAGPRGGYRANVYQSREHFDKAADHREAHAKALVIGPRGGRYELSKTGKKHSIGHHNLQGHGGLKHR